MGYWAKSDPLWLSLSPTQKAAAMALMEADGRDLNGAVNVLGAIANRAQKSGQELGEHVSGKIYQPTIEDSQQGRLSSIVQDPKFGQLTNLMDRRMSGQQGDWVGGATHFLAKPETMLALEAREPNKYRSWREWTKFDPSTNQYQGVIMSDASHSFLAPEGKFGDAAAPKSPQNTPESEDLTASGEKPMLPLFALLGSAGVPMAGLNSALGGMAAMGQGTAIPALTSAADAGAAGGGGGLFGSLGDLGKSMGGGGGQGGSADMKLAQDAQTSAGKDEDGFAKMTGPQFDMQKLQSLLQQVRNLGTASQPRRMG